MSARLPSASPLRAAIRVGVPEGVGARIDEHLGRRGLEVHPAAGPEEARRLSDSLPTALVVAGGPGASDVVISLHAEGDIPVIAVLPDLADAEVARILRSGALAVLGPEPSDEDIGLALDRALADLGASPSSEEPAPLPSRRSALLGASEPMRRVAELVGRTAPLMATALVRGETGTGKELVARSLHELGPRREGPFVKVHCAALPDALLESELFGYEKGAFTGATARKPGRVELAEGGTLFLDEIGDITAATQVKLLRLLQDREYERLGGVQTLKADVRFVAATHRDLEGMVKAGTFREDLFYRLNVVTIWLPPLRARREDIPLLAEQFCREFGEAHGKPQMRLEADAVQALRSQRWPGNVRQLQNFIERLVVLSPGPVITAADVDGEMTEHVRFKTQVTSVGQLGAAAESLADAPPLSRAVALVDAVRKAERQAIERALRQVGGNRTAAARILGVSRATLYTKLEEHGIA